MPQPIACCRIAFSFAVLLAVGACSKAPEAPPMLPPTAAASEPAGQVADVDVTTNVKTALQQSPNLHDFNIDVITLKGDVRLVGVLDSQTQVDEALRLARAAAGTHTIHDELVLKK
jgi:hypothetical protein